VTDRNNFTLRKIVIATGVTTTLAGSPYLNGNTNGTGTAARFASPSGITINGADLYVTDGNNTIRKIVIATGEVSTFAGTAGTSGSDDGTGAAARFNLPQGITSDGTNLYVADTFNSTIRKIVIATGEVTTLAGTAGMTGSDNGTGAAAKFNHPYGITTDNTALYIADSDNHTIRKILIVTEEVTTIAGTALALGNINDTGGAARFNTPRGVSLDGNDLYVLDRNNHKVRKIVLATGVVTSVAGANGVESGNIDGIGSEARFIFSQGICIGGANLFVADSQNYTIRKIVIASTAVSTLAGADYGIDGIGAAAHLGYSYHTATDGTYIYVADSQSHAIRKISPTTGEVTTFAGIPSDVGSSANGTGVAAKFFNPGGVTADSTNVYVADSSNNTIRKIVIETGEVTTLAGTAGAAGTVNGTGASARFSNPLSITTDGTHLYVADFNSHTIRKIDIATGEVTTIAGKAGMSGSLNGIGDIARFNYPQGITTDGTYLYVADTSNDTIRKIVIATNEVSTLAGTAGMNGTSNGIGATARFQFPKGITTDGTYLYVSDSLNNMIRKIEIATADVTTLAGGTRGSTNGLGAAAKFYNPHGITTDGFHLYIVDSLNNTVRKMQ
jgi:DNA-binding beta-propeller fold protein YncE